MKLRLLQARRPAKRTFFARLAADMAGNTLALVGAGMIPILAMVGSGVDMGRSYLSQSRLQQACDAGVLAARKRLGTAAAVENGIPDDVAEIGQRFFNLNFRNGSYGTEEREFTMTLEPDYSVSGVATVTVPTTVMAAFGFEEVPVEVNCEAQLSVQNTDVMMVLDVTGSMATTNPGDSLPRIDAMKDVIRRFYAQMAAASGGTRLRFGFVPYSSNVNVGGLLQDDWVAEEWTYQSRERQLNLKIETTKTYDRNWKKISGTKGEATTMRTYAATWHKGKPPSGTIDPSDETYPTTTASGGGYYACDEPAPAIDYTSSDVKVSQSSSVFLGLPPGIQTVEIHRTTENGTKAWLQIDGTTCLVQRRAFTNYIEQYERVTEPVYLQTNKWHYKPLKLAVPDWRTTSNGCIEERETYEIENYDSVDLDKALDLDLDMVPTDDDRTKWKPQYPSLIFAREKKWDNTGGFTTSPVTSEEEFVDPYSMGMATCPAAARKLAEMTAEDLDAYLDTLAPGGQTYHDIGMIWGGRLISPTGLFADENADVTAGQPTARNLVFLTDGETAPLDLVYSSYGLEPLDRRRWNESSSFTLTQTVENRFTFACNEVKKRNVTVWVVTFGTKINPMLQDCAGDGHFFEALDSEELAKAFDQIAKQLGELRIAK